MILPIVFDVVIHNAAAPTSNGGFVAPADGVYHLSGRAEHGPAGVVLVNGVGLIDVGEIDRDYTAAVTLRLTAGDFRRATRDGQRHRRAPHAGMGELVLEVPRALRTCAAGACVSVGATLVPLAARRSPSVAFQRQIAVQESRARERF